MGYEETHFPFNPSLVSLGPLECDNFPQGTESQEQRESLFLTETNQPADHDVTDSSQVNLAPVHFDPYESHEYDTENQWGSPLTDRTFSSTEPVETSQTLQERSISSCSNGTLLGSPLSEEYLLQTSDSSHTLQISESTHTLPADISTSSQGTLVAESVSMDSDLELD